MTCRVEMDKQGRILLPDKSLKRSNIQKEVTLLGVRDHLELWNRADWEARRQELERRGPEIAVAAKRVRTESDKPV
jgi:MraZ protein